ncbi:MAG: hypothetical protein NW217_15100 [Hyphomicrobiaceae bacterium]|nr:hypothetical protein [Hyphomicrobiaceae bacterium]
MAAEGFADGPLPAGRTPDATGLTADLAGVPAEKFLTGVAAGATDALDVFAGELVEVAAALVPDGFLGTDVDAEAVEPVFCDEGALAFTEATGDLTLDLVF